ncbi:hypothetical protein ILUMI_10241 [Ignelater luminosus]|uniref:Peptidase S1 domain-containing protein n=1 Tax=Ignelater luminosus TaxID=2038154 RepID=A0A8K0GF61_IGNLU|nr:hypothetical protein ILUMI_10241 [Ignelater luminosus]
MKLLLICTLTLISFCVILCGAKKGNTKKGSKSNRIIWGKEANIEHYPYVVGLLAHNGNRVFCGGSIIAKSWVLTAAHCIATVKRFKDKVEVTLLPEHIEGSIARGNATYIDGSRYDTCDHDIKEYVYHDDYVSPQGNDLDGNIGILHVEQPFTCTHETVIKLNSKMDHGRGKFGVQPGWGQHKVSSDEYSRILRFFKVFVLPRKLCNIHFWLTNYNPEGKICVASVLSRPCKGDSGFPLVVNISGKNLQIGEEYLYINLSKSTNFSCTCTVKLAGQKTLSVPG